MVEVIGIIIFVAVFGSILVSNLIHLKNTREILKYLRDNHSEKIKDWGLPDSLMDISPKRSVKFLNFLKSPEYFNDEKLNEMKKKTAFHLKLGYILFGGGVVLLIVVYVLIGVLKLK